MWAYTVQRKAHNPDLGLWNCLPSSAPVAQWGQHSHTEGFPALLAASRLGSSLVVIETAARRAPVAGSHAAQTTQMDGDTLFWVGLSLSEHRRSAPGIELGSEVILVNIPCYPNTLTFSALVARDALLGRCIYNTAFIHRHRHTHILVHIYKPSFFLTTPNHLSVSRIKNII